jgi:hypothetical protein
MCFVNRLGGASARKRTISLAQSRGERGDLFFDVALLLESVRDGLAWGGDNPSVQGLSWLFSAFCQLYASCLLSQRVQGLISWLETWEMLLEVTYPLRASGGRMDR